MSNYCRICGNEIGYGGNIYENEEWCEDKPEGSMADRIKQLESESYDRGITERDAEWIAEIEVILTTYDLSSYDVEGILETLRDRMEAKRKGGAE